MFAILSALLAVSSAGFKNADVIAYVDGIPVYYGEIACQEGKAIDASCTRIQNEALQRLVSALLVDAAARQHRLGPSESEIAAATTPIDQRAINVLYDTMARALLSLRTGGDRRSAEQSLRRANISDAEFAYFSSLMKTDTILRGFLAQDHGAAAVGAQRASIIAKLRRAKLQRLIGERAALSNMDAAQAEACFWEEVRRNSHLWWNPVFKEPIKQGSLLR